MIRATVSLETFATRAVSSMHTKDVFIDLSDDSSGTNTGAAAASPSVSFDTCTGQPLNASAIREFVARQERGFSLGTRPWRAVFHATDALYQKHQSFAPYMVLIAMVLLTVSAGIGTCQLLAWLLTMPLLPELLASVNRWWTLTPESRLHGSLEGH